MKLSEKIRESIRYFPSKHSEIIACFRLWESESEALEKENTELKRQIKQFIDAENWGKNGN